MDRTGIITLKGNALTLVGPALKVGDKAPDFHLLGNDLKPVALADTGRGVRLFSVVPSLDTPTCSLQTRTFNEKLAAMSDSVRSFTISADLPFAQARFCGANDINTEILTPLSDHREVAFGQNYGLLIKELRLLARAVVVVDENDRIAHFQIVPEVSQEPDYAAALEAVEKVNS